MSERGTGPPNPENATPRLDEAARKVDDDDRQDIVQSKKTDNADVRRLLAEYRSLCRELAPLGRRFWELEQKRARIRDLLANLGAAFCRPRRGQRLRKHLKGEIPQLQAPHEPASGEPDTA